MRAVGPEVNPHMVSLLYPVERNLKAVAVALNKPVRCAQHTILSRLFFDHFVRGNVRLQTSCK